MHIVYLAAGAAGKYCGACNRDVALVRALTGRGHEVQLLPLYTPLRVEGDDPSAGHVFMGGINAYLQQHSALFRQGINGYVRAVKNVAMAVQSEEIGGEDLGTCIYDGPVWSWHRDNRCKYRQSAVAPVTNSPAH